MKLLRCEKLLPNSMSAPKIKGVSQLRIYLPSLMACRIRCLECNNEFLRLFTQIFVVAIFVCNSDGY